MNEQTKESKESKVDIDLRYIGNDQKYWGKLQLKVSEVYKDLTLKFSNTPVDAEFKPAKAFYDMITTQVQVVFLDFSQEFSNIMAVAELLREGNKAKLISTVGLHDYLATDEMIARALSVRVKLNHYKGDEFSSLVYHAISQWDFSRAIPPVFALAKFQEQTKLYQDLRMIYVKDDQIRVEVTSKLIENEDIEIRQRLPVGEKDDGYEEEPPISCKVTSVSENGIITNSRQWAKLVSPNNESILSKFFKQSASSERIPEESILRLMKIFIIDDQLGPLLNPLFDYKSLKFRYIFQMGVDTEFTQIARRTPHFVVFTFSETENTEERLKDLISKIKSIPDYEPVLVLFNSEKLTGECQKEYSYTKLMSHSGELKWELIAQMSNALYSSLDFETEEKNYFHTTDPAALLSIAKPIEIMAMDEGSICFTSEEELPNFTVFRLIAPIQFLVTIVPFPAGHEFSNEKNCYYGFINLVDESMNQALRLKINEVFFAEKTAKKEEEKNQAEELKLKYQADKEQGEKDVIAAKAQQKKDEANEKAKAEEEAKTKSKVVEAEADSDEPKKTDEEK